MSDKQKYADLHIEIDDEGLMVLVTNDGRIVGGVKSMAVFTEVDELTTVNVNIALSTSKIPTLGFINEYCGNGKVK
jgi:hypothetical protein